LKSPWITDGMRHAYLQAKDRFRSVATYQDKRIGGATMGDAAYIIGVVFFFTLCALYVSALERI
jgi:hypothetical protein